jgi:aryl-alcohol dehydrogenase-like predicted oxidoreductase
MPCAKLGNSGLWVSKIGIGLWKWGYPEYDKSRVGEHVGFQILDRALDLGVFHWDTAASYNAGAGNSERLLGRYFSNRGRIIRDKVMLATKFANHHREEHQLGPYPINTDDYTPNQCGGSRIYLMRELEHSLRKMCTDRIDLLYLHAPNVGKKETDFITPLDETWSAMDDMVTQGKVRYLAISNHSPEQARLTVETLKQVGKDSSRRIVAIQNCYNLAERSNLGSEEGVGEQEMLDFAKEYGISLIPYFPLAGGLLTGRYTKRNLDKVEGRLTTEAISDRFLTDEGLKLAGKVSRMAKEKGCSAAQLSIAWLLKRPMLASVIAGCTKIEHIEDNVGALKVKLSKDDMEELDKASAWS